MQLTPLSTHWAPRKKKIKKRVKSFTDTVYFGNALVLSFVFILLILPSPHPPNNQAPRWRPSALKFTEAAAVFKLACQYFMNTSLFTPV